MVYLRWFLLAVLDWLLLITVPFAAIGVSVFTREMPHKQAPYSWGWIWGTHDNPPQGDEGYVAKRALFKNSTTGFKGYLNRVWWMLRNPLYGYAKRCEITKTDDMVLTYIGNPDISDKHKVPGKYFAKLHRKGKLIGFEFYMVKPWSETRNLRMRLGWKLMTRRWDGEGYAQMVNTINPFDGYGDN